MWEFTSTAKLTDYIKMKEKRQRQDKLATNWQPFIKYSKDSGLRQNILCFYTVLNSVLARMTRLWCNILSRVFVILFHFVCWGVGGGAGDCGFYFPMIPPPLFISLHTHTYPEQKTRLLSLLSLAWLPLGIQHCPWGKMFHHGNDVMNCCNAFLELSCLPPMAASLSSHLSPPLCSQTAVPPGLAWWIHPGGDSTLEETDQQRELVPLPGHRSSGVPPGTSH